MLPGKLRLAQLPSPLFRHDALDALVGTRVWVKRDDMTSGAAAGNKIRKLEYLFADARDQRADVVITCGGLQSNHARATAILARELGLDSVLLLRSESAPRSWTGNALLDRLVGAEIRIITPAQYRERTVLMEAVAAELRARGKQPYVIPEGGSNALGALGYLDAMVELRDQLARGEAGAPPRFDAVIHACGSGGTAAGVALGVERTDVAARVQAIAVCDNRSYFEGVTRAIARDAEPFVGPTRALERLDILDGFKGPAYGIASEEQLRFIVAVSRACGLILDPVYTGKALFALAHMRDKPRAALFIHTGGLPGLLAQHAELAPLL